MQGYQASCLQDGGCGAQRENTLNVCSKQDFIPFTYYSGADFHSGQEFIPNFSLKNKQFNIVQISNHFLYLGN